MLATAPDQLVKNGDGANLSDLEWTQAGAQDFVNAAHKRNLWATNLKKGRPQSETPPGNV